MGIAIIGFPNKETSRNSFVSKVASLSSRQETQVETSGRGTVQLEPSRGSFNPNLIGLLVSFREPTLVELSEDFDFQVEARTAADLMRQVPQQQTVCSVSQTCREHTSSQWVMRLAALWSVGASMLLESSHLRHLLLSLTILTISTLVYLGCLRG